MKHSISTVTIIISTLITIIFIASCSNSEPPQQKEIIRPVKIIEIADQAIKNIRTYPAEIAATDKAELAFRVNGQIVELPAQAGQKAKKGEVLVKLDQTDFKNTLADMQAKYDFANAQYERTSELIKKKLIPQADDDKAKSNLQVAEANLKQAKTNLNYTILKAPFDGVVSRTNVDNFEFIQAKQPILEFQGDMLIDIIFNIPENLIARLRKSDDENYRPSVIFDAFPNQRYQASYRKHETAADPVTLTYKVVLSMEKPDELKVLPGMVARVELDLTKVTNDYDNVIYLPIEAIFENEASQQKNIWVYDATTMQVSKSEVEVGSISSNGIQILSGIAAGDQIVASGVHFLTEGMKVRPMEKEGGL